MQSVNDEDWEGGKTFVWVHFWGLKVYVSGNAIVVQGLRNHPFKMSAFIRGEGKNGQVC